MNENDEIRLGFVDVIVFTDGSIRGGILVTDLETRPYEFRVTSPIKPTQLQQVLYGPSIKEYVYGELICAPLIKASKEKLSLVLIKESHLLQIRPLVSIPVFYIRRELESKKKIESEVNSLGLITISPHRSFANEGTWAQTLLTPIMQSKDLLEPFERVKVALNEVHKQGKD